MLIPASDELTEVLLGGRRPDRRGVKLRVDQCDGVVCRVAVKWSRMSKGGKVLVDGDGRAVVDDLALGEEKEVIE